MKYWFFIFVIAFFINGFIAEEARSDALVITMEYWSPYYQPSKAIIQHGKRLQVVNNTSSVHTIRHDDCLQRPQCLFDTGVVPPNGKVAFRLRKSNSSNITTEIITKLTWISSTPSFGRMCSSTISE